MKILSIFALLLMAVTVRAAQPAFQDFNGNQFSTTGSKVSIKSGPLLTNAELHTVRSSDGTPGADAITGGVTFRDGLYTGGAIFGTNWVTNAVSAIYKDGSVRGTNINALDFRNGPDVGFGVVSGAVQAVSVTGLVINTTGSGGIVRSNAPNLHAPTLDNTNLTVQIDAQIDAKAGPLLQASTNYANGVTNSSLVRQTQATALSNAVIAYAQPLDADLTAIATLGDPNTDRILFWDDSAGSFAYLTVGANLTITGTTIAASAGGGSGVSTNANQFGPSIVLTLKNGVWVTNAVLWGQTDFNGTGDTLTRYDDTITGLGVGFEVLSNTLAAAVNLRLPINGVNGATGSVVFIGTVTDVTNVQWKFVGATATNGVLKMDGDWTPKFLPDQTGVPIVYWDTNATLGMLTNLADGPLQLAGNWQFNGVQVYAPSITANIRLNNILMKPDVVNGDEFVLTANNTGLGATVNMGWPRATNAFYRTGTVLGVGGANTNFTVDLHGARDIWIDGGTTNVNILAAMAWAAGEARTVNVEITNRTATVRGVSLGSITNNWQVMGTTTFPLSTTNSALYVSFKSMGGSNILVGAQHVANPTQ